MTLTSVQRSDLKEGCYIFKGERLQRIVTKEYSRYEVLPDQTDIIKICKINDKYFLFISLLMNAGCFIYHWDECKGDLDHRKIFYNGEFFEIPVPEE